MPPEFTVAERHRGPRETGVDYFDRDAPAWEREGLGGTEAAELTWTAQQELGPTGLHVLYNCNCSKPINYLITYPELLSLAARMIPSHPALQASGNTPWTFYREQDAFSAQMPCGCRYTQREFLLSPHDAQRHLETGLRNGWPQQDPEYARVQAQIQRLALAQQQQAAQRR